MAGFDLKTIAVVLESVDIVDSPLVAVQPMVGLVQAFDSLLAEIEEFN